MATKKKQPASRPESATGFYEVELARSFDDVEGNHRYAPGPGLKVSARLLGRMEKQTGLVLNVRAAG